MDLKTQTMLNIVARQRNEALDTVVQLWAELAVVQDELAKLKEEKSE